MRINQVAQKYHISIRTLRYYEEVGLLHPSRNESNIRIFSSDQIDRLEQILVFKLINFSINEIKELMNTTTSNALNTSLEKKLSTLNSKILELTHKKRLLQSLLKTFGSSDISKQNVQAFISEQVYFKSDQERLVTMLSDRENIIIEIGKDLIPIAVDEDALITAIKELRISLKETYQIEVEKIRVRDHLDTLGPMDYQILIDNRIAINKTIPTKVKSYQVEHIIATLKGLLV